MDIHQIIESDLIVRGIDKTLLQEIPIFLKRVIIKLQNTGILPLKEEEYYVIDKKDAKLDLDGELIHYYFKLPEDFRELDYLYIKGSQEPYTWISYDKFWDNNLYNRFTIDYINITEGEPVVPILLLSPFPEDNNIVYLKYKVDGSEFSLRHIDEKYWEAIISEMRNMYNVGNIQESQQIVNDLKNQIANPQGKSGINTKLSRKPIFFGGKNIL